MQDEVDAVAIAVEVQTVDSTTGAASEGAAATATGLGPPLLTSIGATRRLAGVAVPGVDGATVDDDEVGSDIELDDEDELALFGAEPDDAAEVEKGAVPPTDARKAVSNRFARALPTWSLVEI